MKFTGEGNVKFDAALADKSCTYLVNVGVKRFGISFILGLLAATAIAQKPQTGNVIFIHPDGTGPNQWQAARTYWVGPDKMLNWDRLPSVALYRGHMGNLLAGTSNGGATTHAFGYKVEGRGSYGKNGDGMLTPATDRFINGLSGYAGSVMREAKAAGHPIAVINDGHIGEPGTGCFLAEVGNRNAWDEISKQILMGRPGKNDADPDVILGGGEENFLPKGTTGVHGPSKRSDDLDLIAEARRRGYVVIRSRTEFNAEMAKVMADPKYAPKLLGLFAAKHTFNDDDEEALIAKGFVDSTVPADAKTSNLLLFGGKFGTASYNPPRIGEMMDLALRVMARRSAMAKKPFMMVAEPESTDNFGNECNAIGTLVALRNADEGIGVAQRFLASNPRTLIITAADSDANGMQLMPDLLDADGKVKKLGNTRLNPANGEAIAVGYDGLYGRNTFAFLAEPDQFGVRMPFAIGWAAGGDVQGGILTRAAGLNADILTRHLSGRFDNVDVYRMLHGTLFGRWLNYPEGQRPPDRKAN